MLPPAGVNFKALFSRLIIICCRRKGSVSVSYTHLDVYKRQGLDGQFGLVDVEKVGNPKNMNFSIIVGYKF